MTSGSCPTSHLTINASNRITDSGFVYDAAGNLTNDGTHSYTYDAENRLTQVDGEATASYVYDANGQRVEKITAAGQVHYFYDEDGNVIVERDQSGVWLKDYVYMGGRHVAEFSGGQTYFVHGDHLGSTRTVTDYAGNVSDALDYLPYGEQIAGDTFTTHKFTGKERDSESGNDYFLARYYGSDMGRFLSPDPMGGHFLNPQSLNRYAYVHDNPLSLVDPFGLDCVYTDEIDNGIRVTVERGDCSNEDGTFVNGAIDTNSLNLTQADDGYSLNFGYSSYDTGDYTLSGFALPGFSPMSSLDNGFGFGSPQYAAAVLSRTYQNTRAVTNPLNIAAFYGASAAAGAAGLAAPAATSSVFHGGAATAADLLALSAKAGPAFLGYFQAVRFIMQNPDYWNQAADFLNGVFGKDYGPIPATWGGIHGAEIGWAKEFATDVYEKVSESVPH